MAINGLMEALHHLVFFTNATRSATVPLLVRKCTRCRRTRLEMVAHLSADGALARDSLRDLVVDQDKTVIEIGHLAEALGLVTGCALPCALVRIVNSMDFTPAMAGVTLMLAPRAAAFPLRPTVPSTLAQAPAPDLPQDGAHMASVI